ncbi:MAG: SsrA-binding protein SmpB [Gammaproteobacteria bacterium]
MVQAKKNDTKPLIVENRRARHDYAIEERLEAGLILEGWEVKSLRAGKGQLAEGYVIIRDNAAWLIGANISPLISASTHLLADPQRTRKLLLHRQELDRLIGAVQRKGYTLVPLNLHWKKGNVKLEIALAKGKKLHDKRATEKERDWQKQKQNLTKSYSR